MTCFVTKENDKSKIVSLLFGTFLPISLAFSVYSLICYKMKRVRMRIHRRDTICNKRLLSLREWRAIRMMFASAILFAILFMPWVIWLLVMDKTGTFATKRTVGWMAISNACVNHVMYPLMNKNFRRTYKTVLNGLTYGILFSAKENPVERSISLDIISKTTPCIKPKRKPEISGPMWHLH
ncbi:melatonin receptor type 1A-like [Tubulanus polymorphus]|uniref:melatonin receptor type 1A-like n=1 Tax=Tubulanus polymorphus TaxID=672921 RepID=UPI003DA5C726